MVWHDDGRGNARGHSIVPRHLCGVFAALLPDRVLPCGDSSRSRLPSHRDRKCFPGNPRHSSHPGSALGRATPPARQSARRSTRPPEGSARIPQSDRRCPAKGGGSMDFGGPAPRPGPFEQPPATERVHPRGEAAATPAASSGRTLSPHLRIQCRTARSRCGRVRSGLNWGTAPRLATGEWSLLY